MLLQHRVCLGSSQMESAARICAQRDGCTRCCAGRFTYAREAAVAPKQTLKVTATLSITHWQPSGIIFADRRPSARCGEVKSGRTTRSLCRQPSLAERASRGETGSAAAAPRSSLSSSSEKHPKRTSSGQCHSSCQHTSPDGRGSPPTCDDGSSSTSSFGPLVMRLVWCCGRV